MGFDIRSEKWYNGQSSSNKGSSKNCFWAASRKFLYSGKEEKSSLVEAKACFFDVVQNQKDSLVRQNELLEIPVNVQKQFGDQK